MNMSRREAEDIVVTWLDETVGVSVSEHVDRADVSRLLSLLGWPTDEIPVSRADLIERVRARERAHEAGGEG